MGRIDVVPPIGASSGPAHDPRAGRRPAPASCVVEVIVPRLVPQAESPRYPVQWGKAATVARMLDCSRSAVFRMVADGRLPHPKKLGDRVSLWNLQEISERLAAEPPPLPPPALARPAQRTPAAPKRNGAPMKAKSAATPAARPVRAPEAAPTSADPSPTEDHLT